MHIQMDNSKLRAAKGMTLAEMLIALAIAAMVGTAAMAMLSASVAATKANSNTRASTTSTQVITARLQAYIRQSSQIACATDNTIVLWLGDRNEDDVMNLPEMRILAYEDASDRLAIYTFSDSAVDAEYVLPDDPESVPSQAALDALYDCVPLVSHVASCTFTISAADIREARFMQVAMNFTSDSDIETLHTIVAFRSDIPVSD